MSTEHQDSDLALASAYFSVPAMLPVSPLPHWVSPLPGEAEVFVSEDGEWKSQEGRTLQLQEVADYLVKASARKPRRLHCEP